MLEDVYKRFENDRFAYGLLNCEIVEISEGKASASLMVKRDHLNGVDLCQGGVIYSLADFSCAMAANSYGPVCVTLENNIIYKRSVKEGEIMIASSFVIERMKKILICECVITVNHEIRAIMKSKLLSVEQ
ncbi:MAG TPA: PaaI family thioesterase [Clostridia bacterium]|nr:PaaI family thioesterase [Clostridia bacterium]